MAGMKGRSGRIPENIRAHCEAVVREISIPKIDAYLRHGKGPSDPAWRWCHEQHAKLAGAYAATEHVHEHSGTLELVEAARAFDSRTARLAARLGAAAMDEWPQ